MKNAYEIRGDVTVIFIKSQKYGDHETIIDTKDLEKAKEVEGAWGVIRDKRSKHMYVRTKYKNDDGKWETCMLHRFLTNAPNGKHVDHINNRTLDNRRSCNLRVCTSAENQQNLRGAKRNSKSGIRGVYWHKCSRKWTAKIKVNGKDIHVGRYDKISDAEKAVIEARRKHMPFSKEGRGA